MSRVDALGVAEEFAARIANPRTCIKIRKPVHRAQRGGEGSGTIAVAGMKETANSDIEALLLAKLVAAGDGGSSLHTLQLEHILGGLRDFSAQGGSATINAAVAKATELAVREADRALDELTKPATDGDEADIKAQMQQRVCDVNAEYLAKTMGEDEPDGAAGANAEPEGDSEGGGDQDMAVHDPIESDSEDMPPVGRKRGRGRERERETVAKVEEAPRAKRAARPTRTTRPTRGRQTRTVLDDSSESELEEVKLEKRPTRGRASTQRARAARQESQRPSRTGRTRRQAPEEEYAPESSESDFEEAPARPSRARASRTQRRGGVSLASMRSMSQAAEVETQRRAPARPSR
ncbi:hypothetical protein KIPB_008658, partial [Kipferlia bialata]|eukprot:g8658.t1